MDSITIPKKEYEKLRRQAQAYRQVTSRLFDSILEDSVEDVVTDFRATGQYNEEFLRDLENGLKKSSYGQDHDNKTA